MPWANRIVEGRAITKKDSKEKKIYTTDREKKRIEGNGTISRGNFRFKSY